MRSRQRIWNIAEEIRKTYLEQMVGSEWEDVKLADGTTVKGPAWAELEELLKMNAIMGYPGILENW